VRFPPEISGRPRQQVEDGHARGRASGLRAGQSGPGAWRGSAKGGGRGYGARTQSAPANALPTGGQRGKQHRAVPEAGLISRGTRQTDSHAHAPVGGALRPHQDQQGSAGHAPWRDSPMVPRASEAASRRTLRPRPQPHPRAFQHRGCSAAVVRDPRQIRWPGASDAARGSVREPDISGSVALRLATERSLVGDGANALCRARQQGSARGSCGGAGPALQDRPGAIQRCTCLYAHGVLYESQDSPSGAKRNHGYVFLGTRSSHITHHKTQPDSPCGGMPALARRRWRRSAGHGEYETMCRNNYSATVWTCRCTRQVRARPRTPGCPIWRMSARTGKTVCWTRTRAKMDDMTPAVLENVQQRVCLPLFCRVRAMSDMIPGPSPADGDVVPAGVAQWNPAVRWPRAGSCWWGAAPFFVRAGAQSKNRVEPEQCVHS